MVDAHIQEVGPFGANSAMQTVHGIPMPIYRAYQLLRDAGDTVLPIVYTATTTVSTTIPFDPSGPLTVMATQNTSNGHDAMVIFLGNLPLQDGGAAAGPGGNETRANETQTVILTIHSGSRSGDSLAVVRTINSTCANPKEVWISHMGSVQWPSSSQLDVLRSASRVCEENIPLVWVSGDAQLELQLEAYGFTQVLIR